MDPITLLLISMAVQAGSAVIASLVEDGKLEEAGKILSDAGANFDNIDLSKIDAAAQATVGPTNLSNVRVDPALREAQMSALDRMRAVEDGGGLDLSDRADLNEIQNNVAQNEQASRASISEQMRRRGTGGSGAELAMQLAAGQGAANRNMQAGLDINGAAQRRKLEAIRSRFGMAGQVRGQDYGEKSDAAKAQDQINMFNRTSQNQMATAGVNARLGVANGRANLASGRAGIETRRGQNQSQSISGAGNEIAGGFARAGGLKEYFNGQSRLGAPVSAPLPAGYSEGDARPRVNVTQRPYMNVSRTSEPPPELGDFSWLDEDERNV